MTKFIHSNPLFKYTENSCIITIQNNSKSIELTSRNASLRQRRFVRDHALVTHWRVNNAQLPRNSEPIRLLETPRSLNEYISGTEEHTKMICWYFTNDRFLFYFICSEIIKLCKRKKKVKKKLLVWNHPHLLGLDRLSWKTGGEHQSNGCLVHVNSTYCERSDFSKTYDLLCW